MHRWAGGLGIAAVAVAAITAAPLQSIVAQTHSLRGGWDATISTSVPTSRNQPKNDAKSSTRNTVPSGKESTAAIINRAELSGDAGWTRLSFDATRTVAVTHFRLSNPYRIVLDLTEIEFRLPPQTGRQGLGIITGYRFGIFAPGKARIVIDTSGPARVESARFIAVPVGQTARLEIDIAPTTATEIAATELASAAQSIELGLREGKVPKASGDPSQAPEGRAPGRKRPIVVVDPGHGGIDPGAQGAHGPEKDIVLAVANEIRRSLIATRRYDIAMTRSTDVFVSLDQRMRISQRSKADLFISIHADSLSQREFAKSVRGATIYTLAEKASDERSRVLAEKENAVDLLAGVAVAAASDIQVRDILVDLMRRESHNFSSDFRNFLVAQLRSRLRLAKDPTRSGPFKVLRQPGSPAVLIELGYMSNAEDERLMASIEWQRGVADAVARAVGEYFSRHPAKSE